LVDAAITRERRDRVRTPRAAQHRALQPTENFANSFTALGDLAYEGAQVSASVMDLDSGRMLVAIDERIVLPTASIGKILLLIEVSARLTERDASGYGILDKTARDAVGDSGVWQHLQAPSLPVADLASLVGATSDNLATNVLLRQVGCRPCAPAPSRSGCCARRFSTWCATRAVRTTPRSCRSDRRPSSCGCSRRSPAARSSTT
jgi:beta-lactamase class A